MSTTHQARLDELTFDTYVDCGLSTRETAHQLGISPTTVTARRRRHAQRLSGTYETNLAARKHSAALDARLKALGITSTSPSVP